MALVIFDLDHTLLDGDSNALWLDYLVDHGLAGEELVQQQLAYAKQYVAGTLDIEAYLRFQLSFFAGRSLQEWSPILADFVETRVKPRICAQAFARVSAHQAQGHRIAIVSATHAILAKAVASPFDLPLLVTQVIVRDDHVTGEIDGPICFRDTKREFFERWLKDEATGETLAGESTFYSDSVNDVPLLETVRHPVAINPDPGLAQIAAQRGWPVEVWRCAAY